MEKIQDFYGYVRAAKGAVGQIVVSNYDKYFNDLEHLDSELVLLDRVLFIIDFRINQFLYLSPNSHQINGYTQAECLEMGPVKYVELFHPLDASIITAGFFVEGHQFIKKIKNLDFSKVKISYSYRLLQKDGTYKVLFQQFSQLMVDEENNPLVIMGTTTDLTEIHTRPELFCRIHYQNAKGKWDKIYERIYSLTDPVEAFNLTPKELEIIRFVHRGLSSKEIANITNRSEETVRSQRKSILAKLKCQSMTDVVVLATKNGWV